MRVTGLEEKAAIRAMRVLRMLEARAGRQQFEDLKLSGRLECDATSVRLLHISVRNPMWQQHVSEWRASHRKSADPKYFTRSWTTGERHQRPLADSATTCDPSGPGFAAAM